MRIGNLRRDIQHKLLYVLKVLKVAVQVSRYLVKGFGTSKFPKSTRKRDDLLCPSRAASVPLRHTFASSTLASQHSRKWLDGMLDVYAASPLALAHDGYLHDCSDCFWLEQYRWVGLSPTEKRRLCAAHTLIRHLVVSLCNTPK
jgi:hypothetical protein